MSTQVNVNIHITVSPEDINDIYIHDLSRLLATINGTGEPIATTVTQTQASGTDEHLTWDSRIHAANKATNPDGSFKLRRGVDHTLVPVVAEEQRKIRALSPATTAQPLEVKTTPALSPEQAASLGIVGAAVGTAPTEPVTVTEVLPGRPAPVDAVQHTIAPPSSIAAPTAAALEPTIVMTDKAQGTYEQYVEKGWTKELLLENGLIQLVSGVAVPSPVAVPMTFAELIKTLTDSVTAGKTTNVAINEKVASYGFNLLGEIATRMDYAPKLLADLGLV